MANQIAFEFLNLNVNKKHNSLSVRSTGLWEKRELDFQYWKDKGERRQKFLEAPLPHHYYLPVTNGIKLIMFNAQPVYSTHYSFAGFIYKGECYVFNTDYRNFEQMKREQYWYLIIYYYNWIDPMSIKPRELDYITRKVKEQLDG